MQDNIFMSIPEKEQFIRKSNKILQRKQIKYDGYHPLFVQRATFKLLKKQRDILNNSYLICKNYLDKKFISIFPMKGEFYGRLWELFLCDFLITKNFNLISKTKKQENGTPDFCIEYEGKKIWIEARVPAEHDSIEQLGNNTYNLLDISIPRYKRLSSSFVDKSKKWNDTYLKNGTNETDPFIIAINGNSIDSWSTDKGILSILYGIGLTQINYKTGEISYQNLLTLKKGNNDFEIAYFLKPEFSHISGVIYLDSTINFLNNDRFLESSNFQFIPNINAKNLVSDDFISKLGLHIPITFD